MTATAAARVERTDPTMDEGPIIYAVPVRDLPGRMVRTVRTGRSPQGQRVGIAFTRPELLVTAMGADQQWEELCESALRGMLRPLGIDVIQVDPLLVAPPLDPTTAARPTTAAGPIGQARTKRTASAMTWPSVSSVRISTLPAVPAVNG
ncbi:MULTISPECIES: SAV_915 family protein [Micromonospora]|uniref:SAV_915 family protein n=1 Tax=Micromonospora TaxID=1873 RepID=UPI0025575528|nr:SAV_915 family protein [Micromonospora sp. NBRC 107095]